MGNTAELTFVLDIQMHVEMNTSSGITTSYSQAVLIKFGSVITTWKTVSVLKKVKRRIWEMARIWQFHYNISWRTELKTFFKCSSASLNIYWDEVDCREKKSNLQNGRGQNHLKPSHGASDERQETSQSMHVLGEARTRTLHILHGKPASIQIFSMKSFLLQKKHINITKKEKSILQKT